MEQRYNVAKETKSREVQWVGHIAPSVECPLGMFWTGENSLAMEYTKFSVAKAIADKMEGKVLSL